MRHRDHTRRNLGIFAASSLTSVLVLLYPTSTNHSVGRSPAVVEPFTAQGASAKKLGAALPSTASPSPSAASELFTGNPVTVKYGTVQVQITVQAGRIVKASAINYPQEPGRDLEINGFAIPALQRQTVSAQSARIDTISGATFTSDGYKKSLQSAIDAAHLS